MVYVIRDEARMHIAKYILPRFNPREALELKKMAKELEILLKSKPVHPKLSRLMEERESKIRKAHSSLWKSRKSKGLDYHSDEDLKIYCSAVEKAFDEYLNSYAPIKALR